MLFYNLQGFSALSAKTQKSPLIRRFNYRVLENSREMRPHFVIRPRDLGGEALLEDWCARPLDDVSVELCVDLSRPLAERPPISV